MTDCLEMKAVAKKKAGDGQRKKPGPVPRPEGRGIQVRLDADLVKMARNLAAVRGENVSTFLSRLLRPEIVSMFREMITRIDDPSKGKK